MKVILTENQIRKIVQEEVAAQQISNQLQGATDPLAVVNFLSNALSHGILNFASVPSILDNVFPNDQQSQAQEENVFERLKNFWARLMNNQQNMGNMQNKQAAAVQDPNMQEKVNAVNEYMTTAAKNQKFDPRAIQLSAEAMVDACNKNNFDLPLLMAQAHLESCFGLTSRARRTNSVFSVGSYDNGKNAATYPTQNDSIVPYINLMKNNYLGNRSVDDLLRPGCFVNSQNMRYASDKSYENKVKSIRNRIISKYPILSS